MTDLHMWTWIAFAVLVVAPFVTAGLGWRFGLVEGEHRGRCSEKERQLERERRKALREAGPSPEIRAKTGPVDVGRAGDPVSVLPGMSATTRNARATLDHTTAADIRRAVVPLTGTPIRPQPAPDPEPRTRGLPALTDTGEIRALTTVTDTWLKEMRQKGLIT